MKIYRSFKMSFAVISMLSLHIGHYQARAETCKDGAPAIPRLTPLGQTVQVWLSYRRVVTRTRSKIQDLRRLATLAAITAAIQNILDNEDTPEAFLIYLKSNNAEEERKLGIPELRNDMKLNETRLLVNEAELRRVAPSILAKIEAYTRGSEATTDMGSVGQFLKSDQDVGTYGALFSHHCLTP